MSKLSCDNSKRDFIYTSAAVAAIFVLSALAVTVGRYHVTLAQLAALPTGAPDALREYLHGDYLLLYAAMDAQKTVYLLSIRHHRQLSFDFARLWPSAS